MNYLSLNNISSYEKSFKLSNIIWDIVINWSWFEKRTIGSQWVRATDSVSANIAEGFGRYGKKDKIHFYRYSQGSLQESYDWFEKARIRKLLSAEQISTIKLLYNELPKDINSLINFTNEKLKY
jgi:four helix bundle protein